MKIVLALLFILSIQPAFAQTSNVRDAQQTLKGATATRSQQQQPASAASSISIQLGTKSVTIPSPEGFGEAASQLESVKRVFSGTEDPDLDMLAVHLPIETIQRLKSGEHFDLPFYTKISIPKRLRAVDYPLQDFSALVTQMEAAGMRVFDFDSPEMKAKAQTRNKSLSEMLEQETTMDLSQPVNLGVIEKTPNSYGMLLLVKVKFQSGSAQKEKLLVSGVTFMRLKQRLLYVYTYRLVNSKEDIDILRNFTKQWLSQILKANAD